jgi:hypothetical protein
MRLSKRLLILIGVLVAIPTVALFALPLRLNAKQLRPIIQDRVNTTQFYLRN